MSDMSSLAGGGSSEDPIAVHSDDSNDGQESTHIQDGHDEITMQEGDTEGQDTSQVEQDSSANTNQPTAATGNSSASTPNVQPPPAAIDPPPSVANNPAATANNIPSGQGTIAFVGSNGAVVTESISAFRTGAIVMASVPATGNHDNVAATAPASNHPSNAGVAVPGFGQKIHLKGGKKGEETFERHPTDPEIIIVRYRVKKEWDGKYYYQTDELHEVDNTKSPKDRPESVVWPDLGSKKVPRRVRANRKNNGQPILFIEDPTTGIWTRPAGDHGPALVWSPCILFRRCDSETGEYLQPYVNVERLKDVDPNDKAWAYAYNKWLDQIKRRRDSTYKQVVHKHHWSHAERSALYEAINAYIRKSGLHSFGFGIGVDMALKDIQAMTDAVNNVGGRDRGPDSVRGQMTSSHSKKNKEIWKLSARAHAMRQRIARGERIPHKEQYPAEAIPRAQFPEDKIIKYGGKGKRPAKPGVVYMQEDDEPEIPKRRWIITSPPDPTAVLLTKGSGIPPNNPQRGDGRGAEIVDMDWADTEGECSDSEPEDDNESEWEDGSELSPEELARELEIQEGVNVQEALLNSLKDKNTTAVVEENVQPGPISEGIPIPGDSSGSDSDLSSPAPEADEDFGSNSVLADPSGVADVTPQRKRKFTPEMEEDGCGDGEDEADIKSPPQSRSIKRARGGPNKQG